MAYTTIDDPSEHFQVTLYSGNGGSNAITNGGNSDLQPDLFWGKTRNHAYNHIVLDSSRGVTNKRIIVLIHKRFGLSKYMVSCSGGIV